MSKKDDAVFDSFDKARSSLRNVVVTMLVLIALFITAIDTSEDKLGLYYDSIEFFERNPGLLNEYRTWSKEKALEFSDKKYKNIFSNVKTSTNFKLTKLPTLGKMNPSVTIARKEKNTSEGLRYSTTPILPREMSYWVNELPFRFRQNVEISMFDSDSLVNALDNGIFNCSLNKRFWTFCDEKERMDPSNYPSGAQYFYLDTTKGDCVENGKSTTGSVDVACNVVSVPNSSISEFLNEKKIEIPNILLNPPSYLYISEILGDVKTIDDFRVKVQKQKDAARTVKFSSIDFSSNYIVPGSVFIVSLMFLLVLSNLKYGQLYLTKDNYFFPLYIIHEDSWFALVSWGVILFVTITYIVSAYIYIHKSAFQVIAFLFSTTILVFIVAMCARLSFQIRMKIVAFGGT